MQFQVPQFLEVEDKLFGSFTFKQFVYLAGGAGAVYVVYAYLPIWIAAPIDLALAGLALALAFLKVNNRPFIYFLESFFRYITSRRLYIWKKEPKKIAPKSVGEKGERNKNELPTAFVPRLSSSKLKELTWTLNIRSQEPPAREE